MSWRERAKRVDLTIVEEEKEKEWITRGQLTILFFFFRDEEEENRLMDFMGALGMKLQVA